MQDIRPLVWIALLLGGIASFWVGYRFRRDIDDDENVEARPQPRDVVVVACVGVGFFSLGYVLFDIFLLFNPPPPSMR
ncbi:hypothetical protein C2U70_31750 [Bradyrhizobium guangdongense]|uniref:hypothetical protein n=1 Tax=Bradyrhizobium guangdongense TaxID=1325090 RepID=UPI00112608A0|nr:hypothetical protein [Bradyrhizobium guangdongense]TPQ26235.1 hypothetical protein C2U70_31750 [Bradyrhizobium guangdongense]